MNGYELSRQWFDFSFENPEKIKPIHGCLYFFIIEHNNRLGWRNKFGLPSQMCMDAIGVKNGRTYRSALDDLETFGFVKFIERSKNQYSSNIIALSKNTLALDKALDKAMIKHSTKQHTKHSQSIAPIDKHINKGTIEQDNNRTIDSVEVLTDFDIFWKIYPKKIGKAQAKKTWAKIRSPNKILSEIKKALEWQKESKSWKEKNGQFIPHPSTYLNQGRWEDEKEEKEGSSNYNVIIH